MNRIVHISLKVDDVKKTGDFYQEVFGFVDAETRKTRDHLSRHMSDGVIDFTLMKYDAGTCGGYVTGQDWHVNGGAYLG